MRCGSSFRAWEWVGETDRAEARPITILTLSDADLGASPPTGAPTASTKSQAGAPAATKRWGAWRISPRMCLMQLTIRRCIWLAV